ncbi:GLPGLI family protein [Aquimarina sp. 2201CG5-10]|uniref:GLPGLI family protein n=1 Tax=Aquimarina callyspongiae TaxID=3098150 RepID=UPI002AB40973|nr:GLPGLI family protein [Aquimarina sp. 2201CG5-10]MDY8137382.1 GLPGLI family protein [Aquimarina sp. 2201CG5-10]
MRIVLLLVTVLTAFVGNSQEITVIYKQEIKTVDILSIDPEKPGESVFTYRKEYRDNVLRIDDKRSLYYPMNEITNDSISQQTTIDGVTNTNNYINAKQYSVIYKDIDSKTKVSSIHTHFLNRPEDVLISENLKEYDWTLTDETKIIKGYSCKRAFYNTTGLNGEKNVISAWYSEDIPTNDGPIGYWGLPGLILEIQSNNLNIKADKITFDIGGFIVSPPTKGKKMTREEMGNKEMMEFLQN